MKRVRADDTSARIKRAALSQFVETGVGSTTIDEIAESAGVGVATFYRRWPDKAALANELMNDGLDALDGILVAETGGTPKRRFLALWNRLWREAEADPDLLLFVDSQALASVMTDDVATRKAAIASRLKATMAELGTRVEPDIAVSMMVGTLTSVWRERLDADVSDLGERLWAALRVG